MSDEIDSILRKTAEFRPQNFAKRFYENVSVAECDDGYEVHLDGRTLKTPGKQRVVVSREHVAELIAAEWEMQDEHILPHTMPVTRLVNVALELAPSNRPKLVAEARKYAGTDLLCYRADNPKDLAERQAESWDPLLSWAAEKGAALQSTDTVLAIDQDEASLDAVANYANSLNDLSLTLFVHLVAVYGSAVLAMAVMEGRLTGQEAYDLSRVDHVYQIEKWGEDEEAKKIAENLEAEIIDLCHILETDHG